MSTPIWSGPRLLTPMTVDALVLGEPNLRNVNTDFAQVGVDYSQLRFSPPGSPTPSPFQQPPSGLNTPMPGVQLHWTVPAGLRSGQSTDTSVEFPLLPNRWLLIRSVTPTGSTAAPTLTAWLLQSDVIDYNNGSPYPDPDNGPVVFIGSPQPLGGSFNDTPSTTKRLYGIGPGDPGFASVYQSAQNILAFYDPMTSVVNGDVSYTVIGFFNPPSWDPLLGVSQTDPEGFTSQDTWQSLMDQLRLQVGDGSPGDLTEAQAAWQAWAQANGVNPSGLPEAQQDLPGQLLCFGSVQQIAWQGTSVLYDTNVPPSGAVTVAAGNTSTEALGAWLDTQIQERGIQDYSAERLIEAIMTDTLTTFMSDVVGFEFLVAAQRFGASKGGDVTVVTLPSSNPTSQTTVPLDAQQTAALTTLNATEVQRNVLTSALSSRQWALFAAQWKLVQQPSNSTVQAAIASLTTQIDALNAELDTAITNAASQLQTLQGLLGDDYVTSTVSQDQYQAPADPVILVTSVQSDDKLVQRSTAALDVNLDGRMSGQTLTGFTLTVDQVTATLTSAEMAATLDLSFLTRSNLPLEAQDILIESLMLDPGVVPWLATLWMQEAGPGPTLGDVEQAITNLQAGVRAAPDLDDGLSARLLAEATGYLGTAPDPLANQDWEQPWTPVYISWQVSWHPSGAMPSQALTDWTLGEIDLEWTQTQVPDNGITYTGRTLLNTDAPIVLASRIDLLLTQQDLDIPGFVRDDLQTMSDVLKTSDVVTQSLSGLTDMLIQRAVAQAYGNQSGDEAPENATLPAPPQSGEPPFQPIRSGHLSFLKLWVVDAWGQVLKTEVQGGTVVPLYSESMITPGGQVNQIYGQLPPRLAQSARLDLELVDATAASPAPPSNASDSTSPICGYVAANHLDGGLLVYDATGTVQGELLPIVQDGGTSGLRWEAAPGLDFPLGSPPQLENAHLQAMVEGILAQAEAGIDALGELLDLVDGVTTLANPNWSSNSNLSLLIGEPVAVVRATVQLQLDGDPVYDQAYSNTGRNVTNGYTAVAFPLRIGDVALPTDGVVGYYLDDDYSVCNAVYGYTPLEGLREATRSGPEAVRAAAMSLTVASTEYVVLNTLIPVPPQENTGALGTGTTPPAPTPHTLTVLMSPFGQLTAITGFLPNQARALAPGPVTLAVSNLAFTARAGPLLVNPTGVRMPLPVDIQGTWNFVWRDTVTTWTEADIGNADAQAQLDPVPLQLYWGWLKLTGAFTSNNGQDPAAAQAQPRFEFFMSINEDIVPEPTYAVSPDAVLLEQTMAPQVGVTNNTGADISVSLNYQIVITLPVGNGGSDLIAIGAQNQVSASVTDPSWIVNVQRDTTTVRATVMALRPFTWNNGDGFNVVFSGVVVNDTLGTALLTAQASEGNEQGDLVTLDLEKIQSGLTISAYANPEAVGAYQSTQIFWTATGGAKVVLTGNGENQQQPLNGPGPVWSGSFTVQPNPNEAQTLYTVQVQTAGNTQQVSTLVLTDVRPPAIESFSASPTTNVPINSAVTLRWTTQYALSAYLNPGGQVGPSDPSGYTYPTSGKVGPNDDSLTVTLSATAPGQPTAEQTVTIDFAPAEITYFSYVDENDPSAGIAAPRTANSSGVSTGFAGNVWTLTVTGPGGPLTRTIGDDSAKEVRYFGPNNASVAVGGTVTFNVWVNGYQSGDTVVLHPSDVVLDIDNTGRASTTVTVHQQTDFTLKATLSGVEIDNTVTVTISS